MRAMISPDWPAPARIVAGTTTLATPDDALPAGIAYLRQVHGSDVVTLDALRAARQPLEADAVTGHAAGDVCAVRTADCLPVLFCARNGGEIAAAHAGWRGLAAGVLENTVAALDADPADLLVWIGPAITQPNFEVGGEVREAFVASDAAAAAFFEPNARGRWQADLLGLARERLVAAGVHAIYGGNWCTYGDPGRFHSYRRDPDCGRLISFIQIGVRPF
jgi:YfiH family protein